MSGLFKKGHIVSQEVKDKIAKSNTGHVHSEEHRRKISEGLKVAYKQKRRFPVNFVDGLSKLRKSQRQLEMQTFEYKNWRRAVFIRDNFTCAFCGVRGGMLHADHINPYASFLKLRYEISNGRTLCEKCHKKTPTWGKGRLNLKLHV